MRICLPSRRGDEEPPAVRAAARPRVDPLHRPLSRSLSPSATWRVVERAHVDLLAGQADVGLRCLFQHRRPHAGSSSALPCRPTGSVTAPSRRLCEENPEQIWLAPILLHHADHRTAEMHYNQAHNSSAVRDWQEHVAKRRRSVRAWQGKNAGDRLMHRTGARRSAPRSTPVFRPTCRTSARLRTKSPCVDPMQLASSSRSCTSSRTVPVQAARSSAATG